MRSYTLCTDVTIRSYATNTTSEDVCVHVYAASQALGVHVRDKCVCVQLRGARHWQKHPHPDRHCDKQVSLTIRRSDASQPRSLQQCFVVLSPHTKCECARCAHVNGSFALNPQRLLALKGARCVCSCVFATHRASSRGATITTLTTTSTWLRTRTHLNCSEHALCDDTWPIRKPAAAAVAAAVFVYI